MSKHRLPALDGLRALAAFMVFWIHSNGFSGVINNVFGSYSDSVIGHGRYGVTLFFVLSAFSLCLAIEGAPTQAGITWAQYAIRRIFRIVPLYFIVISYLIIQNGWDLYGTPSIVSHFTFANIFMPWYANDIIQVEWSIAVEAAFYLIFPLLVIYWSSIFFRVISAIFAIVLFYNSDSIFHLLGENFFNARMHNILSHFYAFYLGFIAFHIVKLKNFNRIPANLWALAAILLLCFSIYMGEGQFSPLLVALTGVSLLFAIQYGWYQMIFGLPIVSYLGRISFSFYLTHFLVIHFFKGAGLDNTIGMVMAALATVGLSVITYECIEQPFRRLGTLICRKLALAPEHDEAVKHVGQASDGHQQQKLA